MGCVWLQTAQKYPTPAFPVTTSQSPSSAVGKRGVKLNLLPSLWCFSCLLQIRLTQKWDRLNHLFASTFIKEQDLLDLNLLNRDRIYSGEYNTVDGLFLAGKCNVEHILLSIQWRTNIQLTATKRILNHDGAGAAWSAAASLRAAQITISSFFSAQHRD